MQQLGEERQVVMAPETVPQSLQPFAPAAKPFVAVPGRKKLQLITMTDDPPACVVQSIVAGRHPVRQPASGGAVVAREAAQQLLRPRSGLGQPQRGRFRRLDRSDQLDAGVSRPASRGVLELTRNLSKCLTAMAPRQPIRGRGRLRRVALPRQPASPVAKVAVHQPALVARQQQPRPRAQRLDTAARRVNRPLSLAIYESRGAAVLLPCGPDDRWRISRCLPRRAVEFCGLHPGADSSEHCGRVKARPRPRPPSRSLAEVRISAMSRVTLRSGQAGQRKGRIPSAARVGCFARNRQAAPGVRTVSAGGRRTAMSYKYNRPEWRKAPVRAQIDEALREVEQVKSALLSLRNKAAQLDEYHRIRIEYVRQSRGIRATNGPARDKAWRPVMKMGEYAQMDAANDLARLDGWMKSLNESELGLHVMLSPSYSREGADFVAKRTAFLKKQGEDWVSQHMVVLLYEMNLAS
jgi:hypothetical protein